MEALFYLFPLFSFLNISDGNLGKVLAINKYFEKQIEAIAKIENSIAKTPNSSTFLQIKAIKIVIQAKKKFSFSC